MKQKTLTAFALFLLLLTSTIFYGCDKDGNPLPDETFVEITNNGESFIHRGRMFTLNRRLGPNFDYNYYNLPQRANGVKYITIDANLHKRDANEKAVHSIMIKIPVGDEILLNHEYVIKSLPGKQVIILNEESMEVYENQNISYIRYNPYLNYSQYLFGNGKVNFTKIIKKENGAENIEGTFEFSIPSIEGNYVFDDVIKGKFKLYINKI